MTLLTVEVNDSEIRVARGNKVILRSAGIAVVNKQGLHVGDEAVKRAYLNPRETHDRHWYKLNQDALQSPAKEYRHHADLVYAHLLKIYEQTGNPDEILFAVPGSYNDQQLSMLLGIATACPFEAVGLVDTAVAGSTVVPEAGIFQHVDMHLHHCIITQLEIGNKVTRTGVITVDDIGFLKLYSLVAGLVADLFIQQSRFDPQHHAETEQLLFDQLPAALATLQERNEVDLEIHYQDTAHHARLSREALLNKLRPLYNRIIERLATDRKTILADRILKLPGLSELIPGFLPSTDENLFNACQKHLLEIRSQGPELSFITSLSADTGRKTAEYEPPVEIIKLDVNITHVSSQGCAYPLSGEQLYLTRSASISTEAAADCLATIEVVNGFHCLKPASGNNLLVNSSPVAGNTALQPGDVVQDISSGSHFEFLRVLTDNGP